MSGGDGPVRVGDLLDRVLERKGVRSQVRRMAVLDDWAERVGPGIGRVTRPRGFSEGTLFVEVRSSAWLMELNMMKGDIVARLNEGRDEGTGVDRIVFVLAETEQQDQLNPRGET